MTECGPLLLDETSYSNLPAGRRIYFFGDGAEKFKSVAQIADAHWIDGLEPHARDMLALSEKAFRENDFIDLAYSVPQYLKEYQTTVPKNRVLAGASAGNAE